jgi:anti-anti-sigma factor
VAVRISSDGGVMTAFLEGDIDHHTAKKMRETIDLNVNKLNPTLLNVDFGKIQFMDSSGIGLIMGRYKLMNSIGGKIKIINIPKRLERMVKLSGLIKLGIFE